jgi:hypothetical protein
VADLDELAGRLDHELPDVAWAEPERIRARGRDRRRNRSMILAAVSVLAIAAGAGWLATGVSTAPVEQPAAPTNGASPSPSVTFTIDPPAPAGELRVLLQPEDVGPDYRVTNLHEYEPGTYPAWAFGASDCPRYPNLKITAYGTYLWFGHENLESDGAATVFVEASRFPVGKAAQVMADVERVTTACANWESDGGEASTEDRPTTTATSYKVLDRDFAGDEALLVRRSVVSTDQDGVVLFSGPTVFAVVRVGDRVTVVQMEEDAPDRMRLLGQRAVERLCAVDDRC